MMNIKSWKSSRIRKTSCPFGLVLGMFAVSLTVGCSGGGTEDGVPPVDESAPIVLMGSFMSKLPGTPRGVINPSDDLTGEQVMVFGTAAYDTGEPSWLSDHIVINSQQGTLASIGSNTYSVLYATRYYLADPAYYYVFHVLYPVTVEQGVTVTASDETNAPRADVDLTLQPDFMMATVSRMRKSPEPVEMVFRHLMTQVQLTIRRDASVTDPVYLRQIEVSGPTRAYVNFPSTCFDQASYSTPRQISFLDPENPLLVGTESSQAADILLLPQSGEPATTGYEFSIVLDSRTTTFRLPREGEVWEQGYRYIYNLFVEDQTGQVTIESTGQIAPWQ